VRSKSSQPPNGVDVASYSTKLHTRTKSASKLAGARERRYGLIIGAALSAALGVGILVATATRVPLVVHIWPTTMKSELDAPARTATVTLEPSGNRCRYMSFDNDTGRLIEVKNLCRQDVVSDHKDGTGPAGTLRRLDAISKSFKR
jgi:hypothetical protein